MYAIRSYYAHYQIEVTREGNLDVMSVLVEVSEHIFSYNFV